MKQQAIDILKAMKRKAEIKRWTGCGYMIETIDEAIHKIEALGDGWIPVTERLPTIQEWVLVHTEDGGIHVAYFDIRKKEWYANSKFGKPVTHYKPLPLPPNK